MKGWGGVGWGGWVMKEWGRVGWGGVCHIGGGGGVGHEGCGVCHVGGGVGWGGSCKGWGGVGQNSNSKNNNS